jgi:hypothetical protein
MTAWYAELRKAVSSGAVLVAVLFATTAAAVAALYGYRKAYRHFESGAAATFVDSPAGALYAAAQQTGTLAGLAVAGALAAALYAAECESGMWAALLVSRPGRLRLMLVKAGCALLVLLAFTLVLTVALFAAGRTASAVTGFVTDAGPGWGAAGEALARSLPVHVVFVAVAFAAAAVTRSGVGAVAGTLGPVVVLAPIVGIDGITPLHPQAWVAAWLGLQDEAQYSLYLWTRAPSAWIGAPGLHALLALGMVHVGILAWASRGDRLFRPAD